MTRIAIAERAAERGVSSLALALIATSLIGCGGADPPSGEFSLGELVPGTPVKRELNGGSVHRYSLMVTAGQAIHGVVEQLGMDVVLELAMPGQEGTILIDLLDVSRGEERFVVVAAESGEARLEVRAFDETAPAAAYRLRVAPPRPARDSDLPRARALRIFSQGLGLLKEERLASSRLAIDRLEAAVDLWREEGDQLSEGRGQTRLALAYDGLGDTSRAIELLEEAAELQRETGDREGEALSRVSAGILYEQLGQPDQALSLLLPALKEFRRLEDLRGEVRAVGALGSLADRRGKAVEAESRYREALDLAHQAGDRIGRATVLNNLAGLLARQNQKDEALRLYEEALGLLAAVGQRRDEAWLRMNVGVLQEDLGQVDKALASYEKATELVQQIGDQRLLCFIDHNRAAIFAYNGPLQNALERYSRALDCWREIGDHRSEAVTLSSLGKLYSDLGDNERAIEQYGSALEIHHAGQHPSGEAQTLNNLAWQLVLLGRHEEARSHYARALELARQLGERSKEAVILISLGNLELERGQLRRAERQFTTALELAQEIGHRRREAAALAGLAGVHREQRQLDKARAGFERAADLGRAIGNRLGEARYLYRLAQVQFLRGDLDAALRRVERAISLVDETQDRILSDRLRSRFLETKRPYYELRVEVLMEQAARGQNEAEEAAFRANEEARAQNLLDLLQAARVDLDAGGDPQLTAHQWSLLRRLAEVDKERSRILGSGGDDANLPVLDRRLEALSEQLELVRARIRAASPRWAALTQPRAVGMADLRDKLLDDQSVLLEYSLGEARSFLWVVDKRGLRSYRLPSRTEIDAAAVELYELLVQSSRLGEHRSFERAAAQLGTVLLGQVQDLAGYGRILVVADGALQYLPFGLFPQTGDDEGREENAGYVPLLVRQEVVTLPSASVLSVIRRQAGSREPAALQLALLADPVFQRRDPRLGYPLTRGIQDGPQGPEGGSAARFLEEVSGAPLQRLPFSRLEADAISSLYKPGEVLKAVDFAASWELATSAELARYRILHFATHGLLNTRRPQLSGLVLSLLDETGGPVDGFLRLQDIYGLDLPAELVVLSGCRTALGRNIRGEGLVGLTRGFLHAGASGVVASLWQVDDRGTAELMTGLHRGLREGLAPPAALRRAQLALWRDPDWRAPYYWAGFVFQGDWTRPPIASDTPHSAH